MADRAGHGFRHPRPKARAFAAGVATAGLLCSSRADAYRPFDGTDADVAKSGSFELEMGPAHFYERAGQKYLLAPTAVLNFGILRGTELVVDSQGSVALGPLDGRPRMALLGDDVLVKHVFREGVLQGKSGLSVAVEAGPLMPELNGANAFGASSNLILSYRWSWGSVHFNEQPDYSRNHELDVFSGVIVEGPHDWVLRPVSEVFYEREFNVRQTASGLVGVIWSLKESFVLDLALRGARIGGDYAEEVRLGFTLEIPGAEKTTNATRTFPGGHL